MAGDDADISDPDDRYINQPEKGPSFHTDEFMSGYNDGYDACSDNGSSTLSNREAEDNGGGLKIVVHLSSDDKVKVGVPVADGTRHYTGWKEGKVGETITFNFEPGEVEVGAKIFVVFESWDDYKETTNGPEKEPIHVYQ